MERRASGKTRSRPKKQKGTLRNSRQKKKKKRWTWKKREREKIRGERN